MGQGSSLKCVMQTQNFNLPCWDCPLSPLTFWPLFSTVAPFLLCCFSFPAPWQSSVTHADAWKEGILLVPADGSLPHTSLPYSAKQKEVFALKAGEWGLYSYLPEVLGLEMFAVLNSWQWNKSQFKVGGSAQGVQVCAALGVSMRVMRKRFEAIGFSKWSGLREAFHFPFFCVIFLSLFFLSPSLAVSQARWMALLSGIHQENSLLNWIAKRNAKLLTPPRTEIFL